ncbi:putative glycosidase C21B10.07 [Favolaschia claudopus]|uniref:Glycosidase C21B10.07 n=1 Tax=Favolaschia claudopus TaxID=2862362 RepID=A0AAW0DYP0_9AGAR
MFTLALLLCLPVIALAATSYSIQDTYIGHDFLDTWNWETANDPTHGRTDYVDKKTAISSNLSVASDRSFLMRADSVNMVPPGQRGRKSVRISSPGAYGDSVLVLDLWHMPTGCATWPAFWTLSKNGPWPHGGETDVIEGVNNNIDNLASLHTTGNCTMPQTREQHGHTVSTQCDTRFNYNQGCGVSFTKPNSYGQPFNANGGGWYAMSRGERGIFIWFWSRYDSSVPLEVSQGLSTVNPDPDLWGKPDAAFPTDSCDYQSHFDAHNIVFDLTFCGDWAGSAYGSSGCPGNCIDFVDNNPRAFDEAYWEISSLRIYTPNDNTSLL